MDNPFIVYLKNKTSLKFEYKADVSTVVRTANGYSITFNNTKSYNYGSDKVRYYPLISRRENVRIYQNGKLNKNYKTVDSYGRYLIFRDGDDHSEPIDSNDVNIEICDTKRDTVRTESVINYFKSILKENNGVSFDIRKEETDDKRPDQISSEILTKTLDGVDIFDTRSVFSKYVDGAIPLTFAVKETLVYPFGCNLSQKLAVESALSNSMSIIEGPPGTGKTQTILNIIANLIVQNKTVAIVSNNNSAVFNVRDKLTKYGYGMVAASLGNNDNKASFFDNLNEQTVSQDLDVSDEQLKSTRKEIDVLEPLIMTGFQYRNRSAKLKTELSDAQTEFDHVKTEQPLDQYIRSVFDEKINRKWTSGKFLRLKNFLSAINLENKLSIINKLRLIFQFGLFDLGGISRHINELPVYVNHKFYELHIAKIKTELEDIEIWLRSNNEQTNLNHFIAASNTIFGGVLLKKYTSLGKSAFNIKDYRARFDDFTKHYPVILSSTLSLHTSIPKGYLFDYLIIDEASQVDIIKSATCFACCRNVIIVGDSKQLTHIVDNQSKTAAEQFHTEHNVSPAYDYVKKNILDSLKTLYGDKIKTVLLKEHYRCHPAIIGFCNKKYYNNELVIMTSGDNHPFRIIETNISGGSGNHNQRQIDETERYIREHYATDHTKVGVIAPYRSHASMLQKLLPSGTEADTVHKFQGREKDVIIFNTVKNKIETFMDDPNLINVAVSRAVKEFVVVKPVSMELPHGTNIGDMIRYISYTADPSKTIVKGQICSVFDLLYKEYERVFISFLSANSKLKGSAAEIIIDKLLRENILSKNAEFSSIDLVREYKLRDLIRDLQPFTEDEIRFIRNNSRIDFLLFNRIDKTPVLAIEVDGVSFHNNALQLGRDSKKNHILKMINLPLLRLSTNGHSEETRIIEKLKAAMQKVTL